MIHCGLQIIIKFVYEQIYMVEVFKYSKFFYVPNLDDVNKFYGFNFDFGTYIYFIDLVILTLTLSFI